MAWKKYKKYIIGIIIALIVWCFSIFCAVFLLKKINFRVDEIQEKITKQENEKKKMQEMPKFQNQNELIKEKESSIPVLFSKDNAVTLIEKLENLAQETNNQIEIQLSDDISGDRPKSTASNEKNSKEKTKDTSIMGNLPSQNYLDIKVKLTGDYDGFVEFLNKIENLDYYSDVVSLQIIAKDEASEQTQANPFLNSGIGKAQSDSGSNKNNQKETISNIEILYYIQK
jgi:uncharacterized protein YxeA